MQGSAKIKVPGGKVVGVRLEYGDRIEKVEILGDFFLHPEDSIKDIEASLVGAGAGDSAESLAARVRGAIEMRKAELIGATPDAIAEVVLKAVGR